MVPVCAPMFGSRRHSSIVVKAFICKMEITRVSMAEVRRKTVQDAWFLGGGKVELNKVSRSASDLQCHFGLLPNVGDGISAIAFCFPATCRGVSGHAPCTCTFNRRASARICSSCATTNECRADIRSTHPTMGELHTDMSQRPSGKAVAVAVNAC